MDEIYIGHKKDGSHRIYWVLNDNSVPWKSNNIMIRIGRSKSEVIEYLSELEHGDEVVAISIDMWTAYKDAIHEALPNAVLVIDRFHVMKHAEEAINDARKNADCPRDIKDKMKKDASLFLKYWMKLSTDELDSLDYYLSFDKNLEATYYLVQEFMDFYNLRDYDCALEYLCKWESKLFSSCVMERLRPFYDTVLNWIPYIMNYFLFRITNGRTEGKNTLIRQIDRMGFHYGLDCLQACIYSHDRNQELVKWRRYQQKLERRLKKGKASATTASTTNTEHSTAA
jgi:transposase